MRLFTSRWSNKELAELECQPVSISRGRPRFGTGYRYKLMRELVPSHEAFGLDDPQEFERAYRAGLEEIGLDIILGRMVAINREAGGLPLVFLCYEVDPADCHRGIAPLAGCARPESRLPSSSQATSHRGPIVTNPDCSRRPTPSFWTHACM
jgi:hypothetical protein